MDRSYKSHNVRALGYDFTGQMLLSKATYGELALGVWQAPPLHSLNPHHLFTRHISVSNSPVNGQQYAGPSDPGLSPWRELFYFRQCQTRPFCCCWNAENSFETSYKSQTSSWTALVEDTLFCFPALTACSQSKQAKQPQWLKIKEFSPCSCAAQGLPGERLLEGQEISSAEMDLGRLTSALRFMLSSPSGTNCCQITPCQQRLYCHPPTLSRSLRTSSLSPSFPSLFLSCASSQASDVVAVRKLQCSGVQSWKETWSHLFFTRWI